jgi:hypothetical protein
MDRRSLPRKTEAIQVEAGQKKPQSRGYSAQERRNSGQSNLQVKVVKVHTSADGKVRAADVEYKLPGESVFRVTTRPIHKLVIVVPVGEQAAAMDQKEEENAEVEQPPPQAIAAPEPAQREVVRATEVAPSSVDKREDPQQAILEPTEEEAGKQRTAGSVKK